MTGETPTDQVRSHSERSESERSEEASAAGVMDAFAELRQTGRSTWSAGNEAFKAFRLLLTADISLARSAFGRMLAFTGVAIAFGASCWLLLMAALVTWLMRGLGLPSTAALLLCALLSAVITALAIWSADRYFEHTRLKATRRQLARLGIGELADFMPDASSSRSAREAAEDLPTDGEPPPKKGLGIDVTPP